MSFASPVRRLLAAHWALPAVCALFLFAGALALDDYSVSGDEQYQRAVGKAALDYLAGDGERAFDQLSIPHDRYYGAVFEAPLALLERIPGLEDARDVSRSRNFLSHLFFLASGVVCYLLALRLFGSRALALIALALFLLHPRIYAHSFFNSKDIPFLATFMIALYLTHRAFRRDTLGAFLLCGMGVGLLVNLRIMGVVLFAAVLALRALDLAFAGNAEERKRALLTGGGFALAAVLTYHASLPVLWTDPVGRFAELVRTLGAHPTPWFHLFRGEWLYSASGPPWDYVPVWVGITTPPATLLLAMAGAVALALRAIRRPRNVLRDGPVRFGLLLAVLPVATTIAVVVLENNVYHDWRQLYFLYAPLLLLAVFGLHGIMVLARGRWPQAGAYALTGAAVAVAVVSMVRVHPYEYNHFTLLADRTTPEHPRLRYEMDYWGQYIRPALTVILKDHPSGRVFVSPSASFAQVHLRALPPEERERIVRTRDFRSGERNFLELYHSQPCVAPRPAIAYATRIYAATLHCIVDPVAWLGDLRRQAQATEPLVRSTYDIHRDGRLLTYVRDGCPATDVARGTGGTRFFLHVVPLDPGGLPPERGLGFNNFDGALRGGTGRIDGNCVAAVVLPDYPIATIRTGQLSGDDVLWEVGFTPDGRPPDYAAAQREAPAGESVARSVYDVYRDGRTLTYVRDGCTEAEAEARFFLHVFPADEGDLSGHRREHGFDNLDFTLAARGARIDGDCVAVARLPDYPIATIRTGQYDETGALWTAEFPLPDGE